ncbi:MAG: glycosyltransferase family 2 protein [Patescibacteria group bacterium]
MSEALISICIPTYNRPREFERMFRGLLPQITSEVELVIRDDGLNLETKEIFEKLISGKEINFRYFKGEKIGIDAANLFLIENARGKYVWWFSDDDEIMPNAVTHVLELLKKNPEITFVWANFGFQDLNNLAIRRDDGFFKDGNEVLEVLGTNIGLLSTLVFSRNEAANSLVQARRHIVGFSFAGLVPILHVLSGSGRFYFLRGPYVLCHPTTIDEVKKITTKTGKIKNEGFNVYGIDFYNIVKEFESKFKKSSIKKILAVNFASLWRGMLVGWVGGWDTPKGKRWKMFKLYWSFPEFWIAIIPFLIPLWINKGLYKIYKLFFSHRRFRFRGISG